MYNTERKLQTTPLTASKRRPVIFLDIDGVLNTAKHNSQINIEPEFVKRLKRVIETTDALVVLTTFWRHFHEYITYVLHRHGIDAGRHVLPLPMGATTGKQRTKNFLRFHRLAQKENGYCLHGEQEGQNDSMIGRSAEDEKEYSSRAGEIEAWLRAYGEKYLGAGSVDHGDCRATGTSESRQGYEFHPIDWKYAILDDRSSAAKLNTPLFDRFILTDTKLGLTEEDSEKAIRLLQFAPKNDTRS
jgi:hypothetical protein